MIEYQTCCFFSRKEKNIFGLKVKKKKKDITDLVLANKGAVGKAWKTNITESQLWS